VTHTPSNAASRSKGEGMIFGSLGIYHHPAAHDLHPSSNYGYGHAVETLCGRTNGIVYEERMRGLYPNDRLCKFCARADASGTAPSSPTRPGTTPKASRRDRRAESDGRR
jgi:hypothetical protein